MTRPKRVDAVKAAKKTLDTMKSYESMLALGMRHKLPVHAVLTWAELRAICEQVVKEKR